MTLDPLLAASLPIKIHVAAALGALGLGIVQLAAPKGTVPHRLLGWIWVAMMVIVSASSFLIQELRVVGPWSPIHLLSIFTLAALVLAVRHARRHNVRAHKRAMLMLFAGALVVAGLFTLLPGRVLHRALFAKRTPEASRVALGGPMQAHWTASFSRSSAATFSTAARSVRGSTFSIASRMSSSLPPAFATRCQASAVGMLFSTPRPAA